MAKGKKAAKSAAPAPTGNDFQSLVADILPGKWDVNSPTGDNKVTMKSDKEDLLRFPISRSMMSVKVDEKSQAEWDLSFGADSNKVMEVVATFAEQQGIPHTGNLPCVEARSKPVSIDVNAIHERMHGTTQVSVQWMVSMHGKVNSALVFSKILVESDKVRISQSTKSFGILFPDGAKNAWLNWLRSHPGMRRLELAISGFFSNGGATAFPSVAIQAEGAGGPASVSSWKKHMMEHLLLRCFVLLD